MKREHLGSRLGFILLSAGCAIGIGNVWKFPYITGQNGGAIFVLIYLACLILLGLPVMTMEFAMGRAAQKSPVKMYQELAPGKNKISLRTDPNYLNASTTCALLGGGGHAAASGATVEADVAETKRVILDAIHQVKYGN